MRESEKVSYELRYSSDKDSLVVVSLDNPEKHSIVPVHAITSVSDPREIIARKEDLVDVIRRAYPFFIDVERGIGANAFFLLGTEGGSKKLGNIVQFYFVDRGHLPDVKVTEAELQYDLAHTK